MHSHCNIGDKHSRNYHRKNSSESFPAWLTENKHFGTDFSAIKKLSRSDLEKANKSYGPNAGRGMLASMFKMRDFETSDRESQRANKRYLEAKKNRGGRKYTFPNLKAQSKGKKRRMLPGSMKMWEKITNHVGSNFSPRSSNQIRVQQRKKLVSAWVAEKYNNLLEKNEAEEQKMEAIEKEEANERRRQNTQKASKCTDASEIMKSRRLERQKKKERDVRYNRYKRELVNLKANLEGKARSMVSQISNGDLELFLVINKLAERTSIDRSLRQEKTMEEPSALDLKAIEKQKKIAKKIARATAKVAALAAAEATHVLDELERERAAVALIERDKAEAANPSLKLLREYEEFIERKRQREDQDYKANEDKKEAERKEKLRIQKEAKKKTELESRGVNLESSSEDEEGEIEDEVENSPQFKECGGMRTFTMTGLERAKWLMNVPMFEGLDFEKVIKTSRIFFEETYNPNESICVQGAQGDKFYILVKGVVRVEGHGTPVTYAPVLEPGFVFGEVALVFSQPRTASVIANETGAVVLSLDRKGFSAMLSDFPSVASLLLEKVLKHTQDNQASTKTASKRVARERRLAKEKAKRATMMMLQREQALAVQAAEYRHKSFNNFVDNYKNRGLRAQTAIRQKFYFPEVKPELLREDGTTRARFDDIVKRPHSSYSRSLQKMYSSISSPEVVQPEKVGVPKITKNNEKSSASKIKTKHSVSSKTKTQMKRGRTRYGGKLSQRAKKLQQEEEYKKLEAEVAIAVSSTKDAIRSRQSNEEIRQEIHMKKLHRSKKEVPNEDENAFMIDPIKVYDLGCEKVKQCPQISLIMQNVGIVSNKVNLSSLAGTPNQILLVMKSLKLDKMIFFRTFQLQNCDLTDGLLAEVLKLLPVDIMELGLSGNKVGSESIEVLKSIGLKQYSQIQELDLCKSNLRDSGVVQLAQCFRRQRQGKRKKGGSKGDWGMPHLIRLNLSDNGISDTGIKPMLSVLHTRAKSYASAQKKGTNSLSVSPQSTLLELNLSWNNLNRSAARAVQLLGLQWLDLGYNPIGGQMQNAAVDTIGDTSNDKVAISELISAPKLLAIALRSNKTILHISIDYCQLTQEDAVMIGKALNKNTCLLGIHMEGIILSPLAIKPKKELKKEENNISDEKKDSNDTAGTEENFEKTPFGIKRWGKSAVALYGAPPVTLEVMDLRNTSTEPRTVTLPVDKVNISHISDVFTTDASGYLRRGRSQPARYNNMTKSSNSLQYDQQAIQRGNVQSRRRTMKQEWLDLPDIRSRVDAYGWRNNLGSSCCWVCGGWQEVKIELSDFAVQRLRRAKQYQVDGISNVDLNLDEHAQTNNENLNDDNHEDESSTTDYSDDNTTAEEESSANEEEICESGGDEDSDLESYLAVEEDIDFDVEDENPGIEEDILPGKCSVRVHLHCDGYKSRELNLEPYPLLKPLKEDEKISDGIHQENIWSVWCMVPPGRQHFFFTVDGIHMLSRRYEREKRHWIGNNYENEPSLLEEKLVSIAKREFQSLPEKDIPSEKILQSLDMNYIDILPRYGPILPQHCVPRAPRKKKRNKMQEVHVIFKGFPEEGSRKVSKSDATAVKMGELVWSRRRKECDSSSLWGIGRFEEDSEEKQSVIIQKPKSPKNDTKRRFGKARTEKRSISPKPIKINPKVHSKKTRNKHIVFFRGFEIDWQKSKIADVIANLVKGEVVAERIKLRKRLYALEDEHFSEIVELEKKKALEEQLATEKLEKEKKAKAMRRKLRKKIQTIGKRERFARTVTRVKKGKQRSKAAMDREIKRFEEMKKLRDFLSIPMEQYVDKCIKDTRQTIWKNYESLITLYKICASKFSKGLLYPTVFRGEFEKVEEIPEENESDENEFDSDEGNSTSYSETSESEVDEIQQPIESVEEWFRRQLSIYNVNTPGELGNLFDAAFNSKKLEKITVGQFMVCLKKASIKIPKVKIVELFSLFDSSGKKSKSPVVTCKKIQLRIFGDIIQNVKMKDANETTTTETLGDNVDKEGDNKPSRVSTQDVQNDTRDTHTAEDINTDENDSATIELLREKHFDKNIYGGYGISSYAEQNARDLANSMCKANSNFGFVSCEAWVNLLCTMGYISEADSSMKREKALDIFHSTIKYRSVTASSSRISSNVVLPDNAITRSEFLRCIVELAILVRNLNMKNGARRQGINLILNNVVNRIDIKCISVMKPDTWRALNIYTKEYSNWMNEYYSQFLLIFNAWSNDADCHPSDGRSRLSYTRWCDMLVQAGIVPGYRTTVLLRLKEIEKVSRDKVSLGISAVGFKGSAKRQEWIDKSKPKEGFNGYLLQQPPAKGVSVDYHIAMEYDRVISEPNSEFTVACLASSFLLSKPYVVNQEAHYYAGGSNPDHCLLSFTDFLEALTRLAESRWNLPHAEKENGTYSSYVQNTIYGGRHACRMLLLLKNHLWPATFGVPKELANEKIESLTPRPEEEIKCDEWRKLALFMGERGVMNEIRSRLRQVKLCGNNKEDHTSGMPSILDDCSDHTTKVLLRKGFINKRFFIENLLNDVLFLFQGSEEFGDEETEDNFISSLWEQAMKEFPGQLAQGSNISNNTNMVFDDTSDFPMGNEADSEDAFSAGGLLKFLHSKKVRRATDWRGNWIKEEFGNSLWNKRLEQIDGKTPLDSYNVISLGFDSDWSIISVPSIFCRISANSRASTASSLSNRNSDGCKYGDVAAVVKVHYESIYQIFDFQCSMYDASGGLPFEAFEGIVQSLRIIDGKIFKNDDIPEIFRIANTVIYYDEEDDRDVFRKQNMDAHLVRTEFLGALILLALKLYKCHDSLSLAVETFFTDIWTPFKNEVFKDAEEFDISLDNSTFRKKELYTKSMSYFWCAPQLQIEGVVAQTDIEEEVEVRSRILQLRDVYDAYSWGERREHGRLSYKAWQRLVKDFDIAGAVHRGECDKWTDVSCRLAFNQSHYFQINPSKSTLQALTLTFEGFLETLVRSCFLLAFDDDRKPTLLKMDSFYRKFIIEGKIYTAEHLKKTKKRSSSLAKQRRSKEIIV